jgi:nicotinamidase-related amidase
MDVDSAVVVDVPEPSELVHEKIDPRTSRAEPVAFDDACSSSEAVRTTIGMNFPRGSALPEHCGLPEHQGAAIHSVAAAREGEPIVVKHRISPFVGTDLETLLRANGIDTLVLAGVRTSGVVLSTVRHAGDLDYQLIVVRDCCADPDAEVHAMLLDTVIAKQAAVVSMAELAGALPSQVFMNERER